MELPFKKFRLGFPYTNNYHGMSPICEVIEALDNHMLLIKSRYPNDPNYFDVSYKEVLCVPQWWVCRLVHHEGIGGRELLDIERVDFINNVGSGTRPSSAEVNLVLNRHYVSVRMAIEILSL